MNFENDPRLKPVNMDFFQRSFVSGAFNESRLSVAYFFRPDDGHLLASVNTREYASGPPGHLHGGAIAALLDETMGVMAWFNLHPVVTASLTVNFVQPLPLGCDVIIDTWIEKAEDRKVYTLGEIRLDEVVYARGNALFIRLPPDKFIEERMSRIEQYFQLGR